MIIIKHEGTAMSHRLSMIISTLLFLIAGCYPVSYIMVGEKRVSIDSSDVKIYSDFPEEYEKIAIIQAGSDFSLKDPSFDFTHQKKTDKALERLKNEAALLGSNGIVIENLSTKIKYGMHVSDDSATLHTEQAKEIKATAIFVE